MKTGTEKNIENDDCREMTEERLLEMLFNDTLQKVKNAAKTSTVSTVGSKMDIIMRIKAAALKDGKKFHKLFRNTGLFGRMAFVFLLARSCLLSKVFVTI